MCRYAMHTYKDHFACFACRKVFRVRPPTEWADPVVRAGGKHPLVRCPDCRQPMIDMGLDFKAPRKTDVKQWKKVEALHAAGVTFHTCGCGGPGDLPGTLRYDYSGPRLAVSPALAERLSREIVSAVDRVINRCLKEELIDLRQTTSASL